MYITTTPINSIFVLSVIFLNSIISPKEMWRKETIVHETNCLDIMFKSLSDDFLKLSTSNKILGFVYNSILFTFFSSQLLATFNF